MQTNKSLGQHWLFDDQSLEAMCDSAGVTSGDYVLEIGPGLGTLTERLLTRGAKVLALEYDRNLIDGLNNKFANYQDNFVVEHADVLKFDFNNLPKGYKVVANIPYYLTSNLLRKMNEANNRFSRSALLMQKEVAERVCASPGDMSLLSLSVQFYSEVDLGRIVPADLFTPPPKVDSQILILESRSEPLFTDVDVANFFRLLKAGFSEKRKKLRSSLSGGLHMPKTEVDSLLNSIDISPDCRAQELSLADWHRLYMKTF